MQPLDRLRLRPQRRRWRAPSATVIPVVVAGLLTIAPASGSAATSSPKPLKTWAASVCTSFARWQRQVSLLAASGPVGHLLHAAGVPDPPEAIRLGIPVFLAGALTATSTLAHDVQLAGVPKVTNGASIATEMAGAVQVLNANLAAFQARAQQLPPNQPGPQFSESNDLATLLESAGKTLPTALTALEAQFPAARLGRAFAATKACKGLV